MTSEADTTIVAPDGAILNSYLARPPVEDGPWPSVVVIHDILGLSSIARDHADRLAAAGYLAVAVDLYSRGGLRRCIKDTFRALARGQGRPFDDIEAARRCLQARADCTGRVGVIGFCMGGGFALIAASRGFAAAAPNYGALPKDLSLLDGACPIVASYGAKDRALREAASDLETALIERGIPHDVKEYPDAGHSFMDRLKLGPLAPLARVAGVGYHQPSAADAWNRILAFLAEHVGEAPTTA
ncbi:MAG: dienelactone hydrolase family protein [Acidimicrobiales bacterium]|uniref:Carboxymethylenebutenolidase n=1 Tax=Candidatus Aeolococcus gillhamiae TaxID=3127015 RepID=A0A2W6ABH7_9BACT|nr:MAG: carboxymethylenebutenolidase [Candidatus Dormibacter sp. RRmetagenome_bin12]